ncbi:cytochrome P450 [Fomitopsis serialis]|uniref:cytochrome P450 n=1 Tax=Fomitopsis serialis TaxID=139415 RepID=UPI002007F7A5|nr:cytochrome P450 [Neoantrodia serialis]KAH9933808.1 cytochrome P450 [Neoantrodia serialis]
MSYSLLLLSGTVIATLLWRMSVYVRLLIASSPLSLLPGPPRESFWNGNMKQYLARHAEDYQRHVAVDFGPVVKMSAYLGRPLLYVSDPRALHNILIKEEHIFQEQEVFVSCVFGPSLLATSGQHHGKQRRLLNPVFSINHMRHIYPQRGDHCRVQEGPRELDILYWMGRASLELIGQAGLGHSFDPLIEDREDPYGQAIKALIPNYGRVLHLRWLAVLADKWNVPKWLQRAVVQVFPADSAARRLMHKRAFEKGDAEVVSKLERCARTRSRRERATPEEEVIAQLSTLIFASMDTTSNTLSRMLQTLAEHTDVQDKLRQELLETGAAHGMSYEQLNQLPYLDAVCRESLRLHPAGGNRFRMAVADTVLPLSQPVATLNGEVMSEIPVPKGTGILIGVMGSNMSKTFWGEDALEWKPERWFSLPSALTDARIPGVYSNLLTFIGGKKSCIGFKFAEMEIKVVIAVLVSAFTFESTNKPISWATAINMYPAVGKDGIKPELPLRVALYKPA